jgi:hypothetical protein
MCEHCSQMVGSHESSVGELAASINHYVQEHGYQLLHVGQETTRDENGKPWQFTVAVMGHDNPPALRDVPDVQFGLQEWHKKHGSE